MSIQAQAFSTAEMIDSTARPSEERTEVESMNKMKTMTVPIENRKAIAPAIRDGRSRGMFVSLRLLLKVVWR